MRRRLAGYKTPILALGTIAASAMVLTGCSEDPPTDVMFTSVDKCVLGGVDLQVCRAGYEDAMRAHLANAPRFDGRAACEAEFGAGQCVEQRASSALNSTGVSSVFVPFLAGYALSSAIKNIGDYRNQQKRQEEEESSSSSGSSGAAPIYRKRSGENVTTVVRPATSGNGTATASVRPSLKPVNVSTNTVTREGFGMRSFFSLGG